MTKEFVPYEEAFALKELGFDVSCIAWWFQETMLMLHQEPNMRFPDISCENNNIEFPTTGAKIGNKEDYDKSCSAPLYQQAFAWFRDEHNYVAYPVWNLGNTWCYNIQKLDGHQLLSGQLTAVITREKTYAEAELLCLKKLIKIIQDEDN